MRLTAFTFLLLISALAGCSSEPADPAGETMPDGSSGRPKVALIMKSLANEFFSTMAEGARAHQKEHAQEYELVINGLKSETDLSRQVAIVEEMVASGVDAIVIAPADSSVLVPALRKAMAKGVVVVNIDNRLDRKVLDSEGVTIPFVGPDNLAGAKKVGDYLAGQLKRGDQVAILEGIRTSFNSQQRTAGFEAAMQAAGIEVVSRQSAEWEMSPANKIAASILSEHPEIKGILAANDTMALGAIAAVKSAGKTGDVSVVGFDNLSAVAEPLREGKILATADQYSDKLAVFGIETALRLIDDPTATTSDVETPVDLVTAPLP
jgi:ribose transport system substrate-binding protein